MKKQIALFFAAMGFGAASFAQDVTFGPMAGLNFSSISSSVDPEPEGYEAPDASTGIGFFLGGFVNIGLSEKVALRPELHFSVRNTTSEFSESFDFFGLTTTIKGESKVADSFIEIPVLVNIMPSEKFNIHVGPSIGLLAGSKITSEVTVSAGGDSETEKEEITGSDATEGRNGFELGLALGAAYETEGGLGIGVRYTIGITDLYEETEVEGTTFNTNYGIAQLFVSYALGK
jgi:hypothetical protein